MTRVASFASLAVSDSKSDRKYAHKHVARLTAEELLVFVSTVSQNRGWGRGLRKAVASWYTSRPAATLLEDIQAFPKLGGWNHASLIRLAHPVPPTREHSEVFRQAIALSKSTVEVVAA